MSAVGAKSLSDIVKSCSELEEISQIVSQIEYGTLATCNIIVDESEAPLFDKETLHILIPDSYYPSADPNTP